MMRHAARFSHTRVSMLGGLLCAVGTGLLSVAIARGVWHGVPPFPAWGIPGCTALLVGFAMYVGAAQGDT